MMDFPLIKLIKDMIKKKQFIFEKSDEFDGRKYKNSIYVQSTNKPDRLNPEGSVVDGLLFTSKLQDIDTNVDFYIYHDKKLITFSSQTPLKDIKLLPLSDIDELRTDYKPKSIYDLKTKFPDSDHQIFIRKLRDFILKQDISPDVYFKLASATNTGQLKESTKTVLDGASREYDKIAGAGICVLAKALEGESIASQNSKPLSLID